MLLFEKGHVILFTRYTMKSARLSVIPEFTSKIVELGLEHLFKITDTEIIHLESNSRIVFSGIKVGSKDQTANLKSIEGLTAFVLDEAEELMDYKKFVDIARSVRKQGIQNRIILIFNPTTKAHWLYTKMFLKNGVEPGDNVEKGRYTFIHTSYLDNLENLDQDFIDEADELKEDNLAAYNHAYMGSFKDVAEGVVFKNWKIGKYVANEYEGFGLDFGFTDPTGLVKVSVDKDLKKIWVKQSLYAKGLSPTELKTLLLDICEDKTVIADSARPGLIKELTKKTLVDGSLRMVKNVKAIKKTKIIEGINFLYDYEIIVDPDSTDLINELNHYAWDLLKTDTPIDDFNHLIDAFRYFVTYFTKNNIRRKLKIY